MRLILGALLVYVNATTVLGQVTFVPSDLGLGDSYHVAFVTDGRRDGLSGDIDDYNDFVQMEAERSGAVTENWGIDWSAIGSTETVYARDNALVEAPVYLLNDLQIAAGFEDLWDGSIEYTLSVDQFMETVVWGVWTGSTTEGFSTAFSLGANIGDFVSGGQTHQSDERWIAAGMVQAQNQNHIYAVSEKLTVVPEPATFGTCMLLSGLGVLRGRRKRR